MSRAIPVGSRRGGRVRTDHAVGERPRDRIRPGRRTRFGGPGFGFCPDLVLSFTNLDGLPPEDGRRYDDRRVIPLLARCAAPDPGGRGARRRGEHSGRRKSRAGRCPLSARPWSWSSPASDCWPCGRYARCIPKVVLLVAVGSYFVRVVIFGGLLAILGTVDGIDDVPTAPPPRWRCWPAWPPGWPVSCGRSSVCGSRSTTSTTGPARPAPPAAPAAVRRDRREGLSVGTGHLPGGITVPLPRRVSEWCPLLPFGAR